MRGIAVLGAGAWGTALANLAARAGAAVTLRGRETGLSLDWRWLWNFRGHAASIG